MLFIDDFLTRRWWDQKPYPHGLGTNFPHDYEEMTIEEELDSLKVVRAMGLDFVVFVVGYVLEMAETNEEIRGAIDWLVQNGVRMAGHGYYHTEQEYLEGYRPWAEMALDLLEKYQDPPFLWRYPRHEGVNEEYIKSLGFVIVGVDRYLDQELLRARSFDVLRGHDSVNAMVHSLYLTKVRLGKWQKSQ